MIIIKVIFKNNFCKKNVKPPPIDYNVKYSKDRLKHTHLREKKAKQRKNNVKGLEFKKKNNSHHFVNDL